MGLLHLLSVVPRNTTWVTCQTRYHTQQVQQVCESPCQKTQSPGGAIRSSCVSVLMAVMTAVQEKLEGQEAVFWPERRYTWGVSEAFNPQHSDLLHLRLLLLKEACDELSIAKRTR